MLGISELEEITQIINSGHDYPTLTYHVLWVGDHGWLPLSVHILIPVLRLFSIRVWNIFRFVPVLKTKKLF